MIMQDPTRTDPNLGGVFISTSQIYQLLLELKYDFKAMDIKLDASSAASSDHETRIRGLEKWKYAISASLISSLAALAIALIKLFVP
ncbi:hypothetical protein [Nonomuraea candida]|uniref:hypothetical protein n=1 Tax=Nonomuraea candida TaxID=359159 RepID=UPI0005B9FF5E|nr:hypothetical protein [Nonomuraea candida]